MPKVLKIIRKLILFGLISAGLMIAGGIYYIEYQLPDIEALHTVQLQVPLQVFTKDGKLITTFGEKRRFPLAFKDIPKPLIHAVLATEDQRYYQHPGIDIPGLFRAGIKLALTGKKTQGGSTITMQVARSFYLTRRKTFIRKIREILLAIKIDHELSKDKILELYLNKVFLGHRAYGVEAAAQIYYGKPLKDLNLAQFAMIAGLPKAPSSLNPLSNPTAAKKRRNHVLERMLEEEYIDERAYLKAVESPLTAVFHRLPSEVKAPYAAELVRHQLEQMFGDSIYTNGFDVYTTLDEHLQRAANKSLRDNLLAYDRRHGFRRPTKNLGLPELDKMDDWQKELRKMPVVSGLEPTAVYEMTSQTVTVLRANGDLVIIPWKGLVWAKKYIDNKRYRTNPETTKEIVKLGDVVYIENKGNYYKLEQVPKVEGSLIALNPKNGGIVAMTGGFDFNQSKFNRAIRAKRQPGSSFKPFVYAAALDKGFTLATIINDAPIVIENPTDNTLWRPQNASHKFYGPTRLRDALTHSRNLVSIRLLDLMGIQYTKRYLRQFGFAPEQLPDGLSLALGTANVTALQMASGFAVFANGGQRVVPYIIDTIKNSQGTVIYKANPMIACRENCDPNHTMAPRAISQQSAFLINSVLRDVIQNGTGKRAKVLGRSDIAGKTGTTQNQVDAWFTGYNPNLVAVAWMGFDQPRSLYEYGAQAALPMWIDFMKTALKGTPEIILDEPPGIVNMRIDPMTGNRTSASNPTGMFELFMQPYVPSKITSSAHAASSYDNDESGSSESIY